MNFRTNMALLHTLSDDYFNNRLSFDKYREERSCLLKLIDEDLNGVKVSEIISKEDESFIDKTLSFLKIDKFREIN